MSWLITTSIAGYRFHSHEPLEEGDVLYLVHEESNPHDPFAVALHKEDNDVRVGYVPNKGRSCKSCLIPVPHKRKFCPKCGRDDTIVPYGLAYRILNSDSLYNIRGIVIMSSSGVPVVSLVSAGDEGYESP